MWRNFENVSWNFNEIFGEMRRTIDVWRAYGDARMPNWPHWHRTPLPGIATTSLCRDKGGCGEPLYKFLSILTEISYYFFTFSFFGKTGEELWGKYAIIGIDTFLISIAKSLDFWVYVLNQLVNERNRFNLENLNVSFHAYVHIFKVVCVI